MDHLSLINEHPEKINSLNKIGFIMENDTQLNSDRIHLAIAFNGFLPNITKPLDH